MMKIINPLLYSGTRHLTILLPIHLFIPLLKLSLAC
jgi:hypothetical protein